jgi:hypothetical protein
LGVPEDGRVFDRIGSIQSSIAESRTGLDRQSIQKIFQSLLSGQLSRAMRSETAFR